MAARARIGAVIADPAPRTVVRATGLGRRFGETWAIRDLTFEVGAGEVLGLLGPNGAGKTTTVRMLTALIDPTEGSASIDGLDVQASADEVRSKVGILTENPGLYDKLSAARNLDYFGQLHGMPATLRAERIERLLRLFGLWERRGDPAGTFSKGMKQKLAIARALLHEPTVLFLDEPTAALDPEAAYIVRESIATLRRDGRTILLATHNLDEASRLCDRIAFIRGGLLRIDSTARLRDDIAGVGVEIGLDAPPSESLVAAVRALPVVGDVSALDHHLSISLADPAADTPGVVRALVAAGAGIVDVRPRSASLEAVYFEVMGMRADPSPATRDRQRRHESGRADLMRAAFVRAILGREFEELRLNRLLLLSIGIPPLILIIAPLFVGQIVDTQPLPSDFVAQILSLKPEWGALDLHQLTVAYAVQQFLAFFLMLPAYIPLSIATFSIVGEKQSRSLEAVLATPVRTSELLAGKSLAALIPGVAAGWLTYLAFLALGLLLYGRWYAGIVADPSWLAATFLLGPAIGFLSVVLGVLVSSRVNDPRTAQQIGGVIIVPIIAITVLQATGTLIIGPIGYTALAVLVLVVALGFLRLGISLFARETILTRWR